MKKLDLYEFNDRQLEQVYIGRVNGLTDEQISVYAKPEFSADQMMELRVDFMNGRPAEVTSIYAKPEFSARQMRYLSLMSKCGVSPNIIKDIAKQGFTYEQLVVIYNGFASRLFTDEEILAYAKPEFSAKEMNTKLTDMINNKLAAIRYHR